MTRRRRRLLTGLAVLGLLGVLALPGVHWRLVGWWRGEPFYRGRPASHWADEMRAYQQGDFMGEGYRESVVRPSGPLAGLRERLGYYVPRESVPAGRLPWASGDPAAVPVLTTLLTDHDRNVRLMAIWALGR